MAEPTDLLQELRSTPAQVPQTEEQETPEIKAPELPKLEAPETLLEELRQGQLPADIPQPTIAPPMAAEPKPLPPSPPPQTETPATTSTISAMKQERPNFEANLIGDELRPEPKDTAGEAVIKAFQNMPEDYKQQWYGLKLQDQELQAGIADKPADIPLSELGSPLVELRGMASTMPKETREAVRNRFLSEAEQTWEDIFKNAQERKPINVEPGSFAYYASAGVGSLGNTLPALVSGVFLGPQTSLLLFYEQSAGDAYINGRLSGLDPKIAADYGTLTGLSEALPETLPLHYILKPGASLFGRVLKGGTAELVQEEITELLQIGLDKNFIDKDMTWGEARQRLIDAGILATVIGPTQAAIAHPLIKMKEKLTGEVKVGPLADDIMGPQMPPELAVTHELIKQLKAIAKVEGAENVDIEQSPLITISPAEQIHGEDSSSLGSQFLEENLKDELPVETADGKIMTLREALQQTDQNVIEAYEEYTRIKLDQLLINKRLNEELQVKITEELQEAAAQGQPIDVAKTEQQMDLADEAIKLDRKIEYYTNMDTSVKEMHRIARELLPKLMKTFGPNDARIVFSTDALGKTLHKIVPHHNLDITKKGVGKYGYHIMFKDHLGIININPYNHVAASGHFNPNLFRDSLIHEFGHYIVGTTIAQAPDNVKRALINGWKKWINDLVAYKSGKMTMSEFNKRNYSTYMAIEADRRNALQGIDKDSLRKDLPMSPERQEYAYSLNEYIARMFVESAGRVPFLEKITRPFFEDVQKRLRRYYSMYVPKNPGMNTFENFLNWMAAQKGFETVKEAYAERERGYNIEENTKVIADTLDTLMNNLNIRGPASGGTGGVGKNLQNAMDGKYPQDLKGDLDTYNQTIKWAYTLLQTARANKHIKGLQDYTKIVREFWAMKNEWTIMADDRVHQWQQLPRKQQENLGKFLLDLTVESYKAGKRFESQSPEFRKLAEKWKLDETTMTVYQEIDNDMRQVLNTMEDAMRTNLEYIYRGDPDGLLKAQRELGAEFKDLRDKNFFPLSRFGKEFVWIKADTAQNVDGIAYKPGDTISFEAFEDAKTKKKRLKEARAIAERKGQIVLHGTISDAQRQFSGMPPNLLSLLEKHLGLSEAHIALLDGKARELAIEQKEALKELQKQLAPGQSYVKHMKHRKNVPGFSTDALRSYASYMFHFSNHIAKIKHKGAMYDAIKRVKATEQIIAAQEEGNSKRVGLRDYISDHMEYLMYPGNELANLRALGFIWYLGFLPKSAFINLTQIPLVTYPYLASRYGDPQAVAAIMKAYKTAVWYWKKPWKLSPGQMAMLEEGKRQGILDESMATELAAVSEGSLIQRIAPTPFFKSEKAAQQIRTWAGRAAWMFQVAEKFNRRVAALAAYDMALKHGNDGKPMSHAEALEAALEAVDTTQYEYARWNRPRFMQGKKSAFFLFWQYKQHTLHYLFNDPGSARFTMMLLMTAGLSGLPFADDAMDLVEYLINKYKKQFGKNYTPTLVRQELRKFISELGANPDLIMHGMSRYSFGMPAIGDFTGSPTFDLSGSTSMGRVIPMIEPIFGSNGDFWERLAKSGVEMAGPLAKIPVEMVRAAASDEPSVVKRFEPMMPSIVKAQSKAFRWGVEGVERSGSGDPLAKFDLEDVNHRIEIIGMMLGAAPTRINQVKEKYYATKELVSYYANARTTLMKDVEYAKRINDDELYNKAMDNILRFNNQTPFPEFAIRSKDLKQSLKQKTEKQLLAGEGIYTPTSKIGVQRTLDEAYPVRNIGGDVVEVQSGKEESSGNSPEDLLKELRQNPSQ